MSNPKEAHSETQVIPWDSLVSQMGELLKFEMTDMDRKHYLEYVEAQRKYEADLERYLGLKESLKATQSHGDPS